ncbi:MAG: DUF6387 family protein [Micavibrio sp.]
MPINGVEQFDILLKTRRSNQGCIEMVTMPEIKKKIIRSTKELPDWFELEKYSEAKNLDSAGWYEILLQRWNNFFWFEHDGVEKYKSDQYDGKNPFYIALMQSRKNPLSLLTDDSQIFLIGGGQLAALKYDKKDFSTFSHAISPLTIRRLYQQERRLKENSRKRIREWIDSIFDDFGSVEMTDKFKMESEWARSFIDEPIFEALKREGENDYLQERSRGYDLVQINLTIPDKILINQFKDYIRLVRKKYPDIKPAKTYKAPDCKKWVEYGLLPYLDLKLWEMENNLSIPYRVMADAILADGNMGEEMIRKTTQKLAREVISKDYINFLATIAAQEIAEKI